MTNYYLHSFPWLVSSQATRPDGKGWLAHKWPVKTQAMGTTPYSSLHSRPWLVSSQATRPDGKGWLAHKWPVKTQAMESGPLCKHDCFPRPWLVSPQATHPDGKGWLAHRWPVGTQAMGMPYLVHKYILLCFTVLFSNQRLAAQPQTTTLTEVVQLAQAQSVAAKRANTQQRTNHWQYRSFLAQFKPQLSLDGSLPNFTRSYVQVTQPDGNIRFEPVSYNNSILNLSLSQTIAPTGGTIFVQKQLQRFDNFIQNSTLYNGIPFGIGITQPLFQFNQMRWDRKIQPLLYTEGNQQLIESLEQVSLTATNLYFDLLVAQVNLQIAETNRANNDTLYRIALHKLDMGKISQNDLLQLQLSVLNAEKDLASARQTAAVASLRLKTFVGYREESASQLRPLELVIPNQIPDLVVDVKRAFDEAIANRAGSIGFRRRLLEAERDLEKARKNNGLNATLTAGYGLSNQGPNLIDVYIRPQNREYVSLQFTLPIMTWGRAQAIVETAKANRELAQQTVEQDKLTFEQEIFTQVTLLQMLNQQVTLTAKADQIGQSRYQIAQDRFKLSDLSVTDLGIATQEKDRARRDAILALRDYWQAFYTLRLLTLFDFETDQKIKY